MRSYLTALLALSFVSNAFAADLQKPTVARGPAALTDAARPDLQVSARVVRGPQGTTLRTPGGLVDRYNLSVDLDQVVYDRDGNEIGSIRADGDGSLILGGALAEQAAPSTARSLPVIVIAESDGDCVYYTIIVIDVDGNVYVGFFNDCVIEVTA